jgi:hypothetical protein
MARISKSDTAPKDALHITLGAVEFDLDDKNAVYETDDPAVIADASVNADLKVDVPAPKTADQRPDFDPHDPHQNPSADHLSAFGSQAARDAAAANEKAIKEATGADIAAPSRAPSVAESVAATLEAARVDAEPQLPDTESDAPAPASPPPTPPNGGSGGPTPPASPAAPTPGGDDS